MLVSSCQYMIVFGCSVYAVTGSAVIDPELSLQVVSRSQTAFFLFTLGRKK